MSCAPVVLFLYNRPDHTRQTLDALRHNLLAPDTDLFIFCDAARSQEAAASVQAVRDLVGTVTGFKSVTVTVRERNFGLAASIVEGVTKMCLEHGRVIVLEDDLLTAPHFLTYMNDALDFYADDERVIAVHGYMFPVVGALPETFFLRDPGCWGWATWKRAWDLFDQDAAAHLSAVKREHREREFNLDGSYDYLGMLKGRIAGSNSSWAILWYATAFLKGKFTLYPARSLVRNIGQDGSGTHGVADKNFATVLSERPVTVAAIAMEENRAARAALAAFLSSALGSWLWRRLAVIVARFRG